MKKTASLLLLTLLCFLCACAPKPPASTPDDPSDTPLPPAALEFSDGLAYEENTNHPGTLVITGIGTCRDEHIVVPYTINGKRVTAIAASAFSQKESRVHERQAARTPCFDIGDYTVPGNAATDDSDNSEPTTEVSIKSIRLPMYVSEIGEEAFFGCEDLSEVYAGNLVQLIGKDAFKETAFYNNPENWQDGALYLDRYLVKVESDFSGAFTVRDGISVIADRAFEGCTKITSVAFSADVSEIGRYAFAGCTSIRRISIHNKSLRINENAFSGCTALETVSLGLDEDIYTPLVNVDLSPDKKDENGRDYIYPTHIQGAIFENCTALREVDFLRTVTGFTHGWFVNCTSLESVTFPEGITTISYHTFYNCPKLTHVDFGTGVTKIEYYAFDNCDSLTELVLPDGVETVDWIVWSCKNFNAITLGSGTKKIAAPFWEIETFRYNGTMAEWRLVDVDALTNKVVVNDHGEEGIHYVRGSYTVICKDGEIFEKNLMGDPAPEAPPEFPTEFEPIERPAYDAIDKSPINYTTVKLHADGMRETTLITEQGFYYQLSIDGKIERELYGRWTAGDPVVYMKKDGAWYLCLTNPSFDYIAEELPPYGMLHPSEEQGLYVFAIGDAVVSEIRLGFLDGNLAYVALYSQSALEQEYHFFDYGTTVLPDFSYSDVVDGVILDHNGNVLTDIEHLS